MTWIFSISDLAFFCVSPQYQPSSRTFRLLVTRGRYFGFQCQLRYVLNIFQLFHLGINCNPVFGVNRCGGCSRLLWVAVAVECGGGGCLPPHPCIHPRDNRTSSTHDATKPRKLTLDIRNGLQNLSLRTFLGIFTRQREEVRRKENDFVIRALIICVFRRLLLGRWNQERRDGRHNAHEHLW